MYTVWEVGIQSSKGDTKRDERSEDGKTVRCTRTLFNDHELKLLEKRMNSLAWH